MALQPGLCRTWSETPKTGFLATGLVHFSDFQEELKKAILASIEDFDPENPWIVDASGRHTNVAALLDWPSDDSDDSDSMSDARRQRNQNDQQEQGKLSRIMR